EVSDARKIRNRLLTNFERACLPSSDLSEIENILHVVIVGGGPTGVEFGAELYDFINQDIAKLFKRQGHFNVRVTLVEAVQILQSFDKRLQLYA
uniref:NADH:ubiquinone reductase (non-electrogenic) n=1 Tax=Romanomermis culicivorax TaxID=13658 RepID=A0A915ILZ6_ROMCU